MGMIKLFSSVSKIYNFKPKDFKFFQHKSIYGRYLATPTLLMFNSNISD